jgi:hypothetical protein
MKRLSKEEYSDMVGCDWPPWQGKRFAGFERWSYGRSDAHYLYFYSTENSLVDYLYSKMGDGHTILSDAKKIIVAHRDACPLHHVKDGASSPMCTSTDNSEMMVTCVLVDGFCIGKEY